MRTKLVAGNWKMHGRIAQLGELDLIGEVARAHPGVDVSIAVPFTLIALAAGRAGGVTIGAQDCHEADSGAHTGGVAAPMLHDAGARFAIVGHSERRAAQRESDREVKAKAEAAHRSGLAAILCVGETEAERDAGRAVSVVSAQVMASLPDEAAADWLVIAYEPIWAIGTGKFPTLDDVAAMHAAIRATLRARLGDEADAMRIVYGGSVTGENARGLFGLADVDGALVGGASLTAEKFGPIIMAADG